MIIVTAVVLVLAGVAAVVIGVVLPRGNNTDPPVEAGPELRRR
jgi:hypothetical protein